MAEEEVVEEVEEVEEEVVEQAWPEDWRARIAGDDEKSLEQLGRYADPSAIWTKARALEQRVTSGELKDYTPFPDKGSDDDKAAWRSNNNVPDSFEKYDIGREIKGDNEEAVANEKEVINEFLEYAYSKNMPTAQVQNMVEWFYTKRERDDESIAETDKQIKQEAEDKLRADWGTDYRGHLNRIDNLIETAPTEIKEGFLNSRMPNGLLFRDSPEAMRFFLNLAIMENPVTTVVPAGGDQMSSIQDEIDEIKGKMNSKEYRAKNSPMRKRYGELLEAQQALGKRK